ncbi:MAG: glycerophosphodiester phosphodiesterase [Ruminococcaceae bacterium]|nr:glycerophosphodiester phosphodiesterase [Oscillospiraceae bacterium]
MKVKKCVIIVAAFVVSISIIVGGVIFMDNKKETEFYKSQQINLPKDFTYTAHTGCCGTSDNSLEAIKVGIEHGAQIVEFDLYFNTENIAVLSHDAPKGNEVTLDEAFKLISTYENVQVNVDVKLCNDYLHVVYNLAEKYKITKRVFFTGINVEDIETVKKECPTVPYYLNYEVKKENKQTPEYLNDLVKIVKDSGAVGINFNKDSATKDLVDTFHNNDLLVSIWTVNEEKDMYKILYFAPDNITTRNPDVLKKLLTD